MKIKAQVIANPKEYFEQLRNFEERDPILREFDKPEMKLDYATVYIQQRDISRFKVYDNKIIIETYDEETFVCDYNDRLEVKLEILFNKLDEIFEKELN